jgi:hypothetical protein
MNKYDTIQYVIACLLTHAEAMKTAINQHDVLDDHFNLSSHDKLNMACFLKESPDRLLATAFMMEEKRYREMMACLRYAPILLNAHQLKYFWESYLKTLRINYIPASPLEEAICFLKHIISCLHPNSIDFSVVEYELMLSVVLSYGFYPQQPDTQKDKVFKKRTKSVLMNPSLLVKTFSFPISQIICLLNEKKLSQIIKIEKKEEDILFVKDRKTGLVKAMSFNKNSLRLFARLIQSSNPKQWIDDMRHTEKMSKKALMNYLYQLVVHDVVSLNEE